MNEPAGTENAAQKKVFAPCRMQRISNASTRLQRTSDVGAGATGAASVLQVKSAATLAMLDQNSKKKFKKPITVVREVDENASKRHAQRLSDARNLVAIHRSQP